MKRFWLVLLSLGLIVAFSTSAMAVDVKFSGSYYAAGLYQDKTTFVKDATLTNVSTAFYFQRLRLQTEFVVSPGLSLVTRFDAMERAWGAARSNATILDATGKVVTDQFSQGTAAENENIAFDWAYIKYVSPIGMFQVGIQEDGVWGTQFGDNASPLGRITWFGQFGPVTALAYIGKFAENSYTAKATTVNATDRDIDQFVAAVIYSFKGGSAGLLGKYLRAAATRNPLTGPFYSNMYFLDPYAIVQIGPVKVQAELTYGWGDYQKFESGVGNVSLDNWAGWVDAVADFGIVYVGATAAYVAGDDKGTTDKKEGGVINGGADWNPTLILFNYDRYYWAGSITGYSGTANPNAADNYLATNNSGMTNAWFGQGRVGVRPVAALDIMGSVSVAYADKKPAVVINNDYGWEVDVTATYKITNNLSYMLGVGYLFTGAYFKGASNANTINDDFLVINKLTLTF